MAPSLFLLASLSLAFLYGSQADLISNVCSQSLNPPLCTKILRSDPRSRVADLRGLGQIVIEKAIAATGATIVAAKSVSGGGNAQIVDVCIETCNYAIDDLDECSDLLKKDDERSVEDIRAKGSGALTNVGTCDDEFGETEPAMVKAASKKAEDLIGVLLVIANML